MTMKIPLSARKNVCCNLEIFLLLFLLLTQLKLNPFFYHAYTLAIFSLYPAHIFLQVNRTYILLNGFSLLFTGRAQKNAKHGADDKAKNLMEAMHEKMTLRESTRPHIFKAIR
jgi:hypothetical protein